MRKEFLAGLSTFFTVSYLLVLYPKILSEGGVNFGAALTATILTIIVATLFLGIYANFPVILVPGLSVGPFLVYSVILKQGASWQIALGLVFWTGLIIFLLSIFKVRQKILLHLPLSIKSAAIAGIGLFLICVGIKDLTLTNGNIFNFPNAIVLLGLVVFFILFYFRISASFLLTILFCWCLAIPFGFIQYKGLVAWPTSLAPTFLELDFLGSLHFEWLGTLLSVTLICLFDTSVAISVLAKLSHRVDNRGHVKQIDRIVIPDGPCSMLAAVLGTGTLTFAIESTAGINVGGRTRITAITAALCCVVALFFYPLLSGIPLFVTTPVLIAIGALMTREIRVIRWRYLTESIPALIILFTIPLTFSIYLGFALGFVAHAFIKAVRGEWKDVHPVCWTLAAIFTVHFIWAMAIGHY